MKSDYDGAWKSLVETHLREVFALYFPEVAREIDWSHRPKLLAQELKQLGIQEESLEGQRVDFLIEVKTRMGDKKVLFLHLEIQSKREPGFAMRIFRYYQKISSHTNRSVVTLAVLADTNPGWCPQSYEQEVLGCRVVFEFPVCKLLNLLPKIEQVRSLPALAARVQIEALRTRGDVNQRLKSRLEFCREFLGEGWKKHEIMEAFRLVSWMMRLPRAESLQFREIVSEWPEMKTTVPLTDLEEIWLEEGLEKGIEQGLEKGIEQGREIGEFMGKVVLLEKLLGKPFTSELILKSESLKQLKSRFQKLEKEYHKRFR